MDLCCLPEFYSFHLLKPCLLQNRFRKYKSGSQKRKKKQRIEELTQTQKGAMDRFIVKESNVLSGNEAVDQGPALDSNIENDLRDGQTGTENNAEVQEVLINNTNVETANDGEITVRILVILFSLIYLIQDIGIH